MTIAPDVEPIELPSSQDFSASNKRRSSLELNLVNNTVHVIQPSPAKSPSFPTMKYVDETDPIPPLEKVESFLEKNVLEIIESETGKPYNITSSQYKEEQQDIVLDPIADPIGVVSMEDDSILPPPPQLPSAEEIKSESISTSATNKFTSLLSSIKSFVTGKLSPSPTTTTTNQRLSKVVKQNKTQGLQSLKAAEIARKKEEEKKKKLEEKKKQNEEKKKANQVSKQKQMKPSSSVVDKKAMLKDKLEKAKQSKTTTTTAPTRTASIPTSTPTITTTTTNIPFATPAPNKNRASQITPLSTASKLSINSVNSSYYDMTDEYYSETDDELEKKRANKKIPQWVKDGKLLNEFLENTEQLDPDCIFSPVRTCNLEEIFQNSTNAAVQTKKKPTREYGTRTSSCNWTRDHFTSEEEMRYKQEMGYKPLQFR